MRKIQQFGFAADVYCSLWGVQRPYSDFCKDKSGTCPNIRPPKLNVAAEEPIDRQDPFVRTDLSLLDIKQEAYTLVYLCQKSVQTLRRCMKGCMMHLSQMMPLPGKLKR